MSSADQEEVSFPATMLDEARERYPALRGVVVFEHHSPV